MFERVCLIKLTPSVARSVIYFYPELRSLRASSAWRSRSEMLYAASALSRRSSSWQGVDTVSPPGAGRWTARIPWQRDAHAISCRIGSGKSRTGNRRGERGFVDLDSSTWLNGFRGTKGLSTRGHGVHSTRYVQAKLATITRAYAVTRTPYRNWIVTRGL